MLIVPWYQSLPQTRGDSPHTSPQSIQNTHQCHDPWRHTLRMTTSPSLASRFIGPIGAVAVLAYAVFAAVQIQVLNPLATMPGYTLQEIHAAVAQRDSADTMGWGLMSVTLAIGPLIALIVARLGVLGRLPAGTVLMIMLGLLSLGSPGYLIASFPAGMTLADTFMVGGADHAPWGRILHALSTLSTLALAGLVIARSVRASQESTTGEVQNTKYPS